MNNLEIIKRKAIQIFSEEDLDRKIKSEEKLTIKLGADPSRPDLHIGHSIVLGEMKILPSVCYMGLYITNNIKKIT